MSSADISTRLMHTRRFPTRLSHSMHFRTRLERPTRPETHVKRSVPFSMQLAYFLFNDALRSLLAVV